MKMNDQWWHSPTHLPFPSTPLWIETRSSTQPTSPFGSPLLPQRLLLQASSGRGSRQWLEKAYYSLLSQFNIKRAIYRLPAVQWMALCHHHHSHHLHPHQHPIASAVFMRIGSNEWLWIIFYIALWFMAIHYAEQLLSSYVWWWAGGPQLSSLAGYFSSNSNKQLESVVLVFFCSLFLYPS